MPDPVKKPTADAKSKPGSRLGPTWRVLIHNDDVTTMDCVVRVLVEAFSKPAARAEALMLEAHRRGVALVGVYPKEQAELRVELATRHARRHLFPLTLTLEPNDDGLSA